MMKNCVWAIFSFVFFLNYLTADGSKEDSVIKTTSNLSSRRREALFLLWKKGVEQGKTLEKKYVQSLLKRFADKQDMSTNSAKESTNLDSLPYFRRTISSLPYFKRGEYDHAYYNSLKNMDLPYFKKSAALPYFNHDQPNAYVRQEELNSERDILPYFKRKADRLPYFVRGFEDELPYFKRNTGLLPYYRREGYNLPYFRRESEELPFFQRDIEALPYFKRDATELPYFKKDADEKESSELDKKNKGSSTLKRKVTGSKDSKEKKSRSNSGKTVVKRTISARPSKNWFNNRWGKGMANRVITNNGGDENDAILKNMKNLRMKLVAWLNERKLHQQQNSTTPEFTTP